MGQKRIPGRCDLVAVLVGVVLTATQPLHGQAISEGAQRCLSGPPTDRAVAVCRESVRAAPNDASLRRALAAALIARGDTVSALAEFNHILHADPHSARAQLDVATILDRMGRSDEALRAYR